MTDKTDGVLAVLDREIFLAPWQEAAQTLKDIRDKVAELLAADEEYDAAKSAFYRDFGAKASSDRLSVATTRRYAAIRAMRGEPPVG